jgi:ABC-2 type transport system permease protein
MTILRRVFLLAAKDLRLLFSSYVNLFLVFVFPLLFVAGFSLALPDVGDEDQIEVYLASAEAEGVGPALIAGMTSESDSPFRALSPEEAERLLDEKEIDGYILLPNDLTATLAGAAPPTTIEAVVDPDAADTRAMLVSIARDIAHLLMLADAAVTAAERAIAASGQDPSRYAAALRQAAAGNLLGATSGVALRVEQVGDTEPVPAASYVLTGYITMFLFFAAAASAGELIRERTNQTLERLVAMGVGRSTVLAGKWVGGAVRGMLQAGVMWAAGILIFGVKIGDEPFAVMLVTLAMLAASVSFTLFLASIVSTTRAADSASTLASLILAALGGSWWPLFIMPKWMQTLAKVSPHAWANEAFNRLMLFGATLGDVWVNLVVLLGFALGFAALAARRVRLVAE